MSSSNSKAPDQSVHPCVLIRSSAVYQYIMNRLWTSNPTSDLLLYRLIFAFSSKMYSKVGLSHGDWLIYIQ